MDPLSLIFVPGGYAAALALLSPLGVVAHRLWKRRGLRRNEERRCSRCAAHFEVSDELFWFDGMLHCAPCATTLRRRLRVALPVIGAVAVAFAVSSGSALVVSTVRGGPGLSWWLDGRWIPLLLPSVGVALATATVVALGKRANRLAAGAPNTALRPGYDPSAFVRLRIGRLPLAAPRLSRGDA